MKNTLRILCVVFVGLVALGACSNSSFFSTLGNKIEVPQLAISPATATVPANGNANFSASGGVPPYTFSVTSGPGSIGASTGVYTATATPAAAIVQVKDKQGSTAKAIVNLATYTVTAVSNTGALLAGGTANGNFTIKNTGTSDGTQTISWTVYASPTSTLGAGSSVIQSSTTGPLNNGVTSSPIPFSGSWPATPGSYYLIASISSADSAGASLATGSTFNIVPAQVNYSVVVVNYGAVTTTPGGSVSGTFQIKNSGPQNGTQNVTWQVYASTTNTLTATPAPVLIGPGGFTGPLASGVTSTVIAFSGNWPLTHGNYYLVVKLTVPVDNNTNPNPIGATATPTAVGFYSVGTPHQPYTSPYDLGITFQPGMSISVTGSLASGDATNFLKFSTGTASSITFSASWSPLADATLQVFDPGTGSTLSSATSVTNLTAASLGPWAVDLQNTQRLINILSPGPYPGTYTLIITAN